MDYVPIFVNHDVSIMSVFYLKKVTNNGVRRHRFDEISSCFLEVLGTFIAVLVKEVFVKPGISLSAELISRLSIGNAFNNTALK